MTPDTSAVPSRRAPRRGSPWTPLISGIVLLAILLGPRVEVEERWTDFEVGADPEAAVHAGEATVPGLDPAEAKEIVWHEPDLRARTPLSVVYLHGFSADRHELDPLPRLVADALGANLFYSRLAGHGLDGPALAEATVEEWLDDGAQAIAVGRAIGERVILLGTSTGGTLATWVASRDEARDDVAALALLSPNFGLNTPAGGLLLWPWGNLIARAVVGRERCFEPVNEAQREHWTTCYPVEATLPMMAMVELTTSGDLDRVRAPALFVYSAQDLVVSPEAALRTLDRLGSTEKRAVEIAGAERGGYHINAGDIVSPETTDEVAGIVIDFLREVLGNPGG